MVGLLVLAGVGVGAAFALGVFDDDQAALFLVRNGESDWHLLGPDEQPSEENAVDDLPVSFEPIERFGAGDFGLGFTADGRHLIGRAVDGGNEVILVVDPETRAVDELLEADDIDEAVIVGNDVMVIEQVGDQQRCHRLDPDGDSIDFGLVAMCVVSPFISFVTVSDGGDTITYDFASGDELLRVPDAEPVAALFSEAVGVDVGDEIVVYELPSGNELGRVPVAEPDILWFNDNGLSVVNGFGPGTAPGALLADGQSRVFDGYQSAQFIERGGDAILLSDDDGGFAVHRPETNETVPLGVTGVMETALDQDLGWDTLIFDDDGGIHRFDENLQPQLVLETDRSGSFTDSFRFDDVIYLFAEDLQTNQVAIYRIEGSGGREEAVVDGSFVVIEIQDGRVWLTVEGAGDDSLFLLEREGVVEVDNEPEVETVSFVGDQVYFGQTGPGGDLAVVRGGVDGEESEVVIDDYVLIAGRSGS